MALRLLRISGFAAALAYMFHMSRQASIARGHEDTPGLLWAIGVLCFFFLIRASLSELMPNGPKPVQRDLLWGLCIGGIATILIRSFGG